MPITILAFLISLSSTLAGALGILFTIIGIIGTAITMAVAVAWALNIDKFWNPIVILVVSIIWAILFINFLIRINAQAIPEPQSYVLIIAKVFIVLVLIFGAYLGNLSHIDREKYGWINQAIITFIVAGGTSFRGANLTLTDFTKASLNNTDLRKTTINQTNWYQVKKLDSAIIDDTILNNLDVLKLVTEPEKAKIDINALKGKHLSGAKLSNANLSQLNLSGADLYQANLVNADLYQANLIRTNLIRSNLTKANLTKAKLNGADLILADLCQADLREADLRRVQALSTNFEGANFTGACIKDWNINPETKLDNVICDYVYLKEKQQERRPANGNFAPGDFERLVKKTIDTVDLIFSDGIDWNAFLFSFQKLQNKYGKQNVAVQAIERKTNIAFVVRIEVSPNINKAEVEKYVRDRYRNKLKALEDKYRLQLNAKDKEIEIYKQKSIDLLELVKLAASRPINITQTQGNNMAGDRYSVTGNDNQVVQGQNIRATQKNQANKNNEEELTPAQVVELLAELIEKIQQSALPENIKDNTLKRLGASSVEAREQEPDKQLLAGTLKRVTENLSQATKATEEGKKLWNEIFPILKTIGTWVGLAGSFFSNLL